ncbi:hypothetical protein PoB_005282600 [Plakobranchus ocellatus]|uniref:Uncharacterized protein n=1 Tax=Plakobranchus ocellatus TaxID=259542 RepID=A0AAV4BSX8_9GAST|nr:hypothetical protein PoB_005282600 [Plakobranchus ocellatus]
MTPTVIQAFVSGSSGKRVRERARERERVRQSARWLDIEPCGHQPWFSNEVRRNDRTASVLPASDELTTCLSPDRELRDKISELCGFSVAQWLKKLDLKSAKTFLSCVPVWHQSALDKCLEACDYLVLAAGGFSVALKSAAASSRQFIPATAWFEGGEGGAKLIWLEPKVFRCQ